MSASDNRWKFFVGASQRKGPMSADDVEDMYKKVINPEGVKLEDGYESIDDYLEAIPGFRRTNDDLFSLSEADALYAFKKQAIKANVKTRAVDAFTKSFSEIYKKEKVDAHHVKKDLLTHFCLTPPPSVGFLEVSRLFDEEVSKHNEAVKKCFKQFKSFVLFHSRAFHLFNEILPLLFTAEQFSKAYCDIFEVDEVPFDDFGFSSVQELLEWLPEIRFRNGVCLVLPNGYVEKVEHVEEVKKDSDDKVEKEEKATEEQPPKKRARIDVPEAVPQEKIPDDEKIMTDTQPLKEGEEGAEEGKKEVQEVKEPSVELQEMTNEPKEDVNMNLDCSEEKIIIEEEEEVQEEFMEIEEDEQIIARRQTCRENEFDDYDEDAEEEVKKEGGDEEMEEADLMEMSFTAVGEDRTIETDSIDDSTADSDYKEFIPTD